MKARSSIDSSVQNWINDDGHAEPRGNVSAVACCARAASSGRQPRHRLPRPPGCRRLRASTIRRRSHDACGVGFVANMHNKKSHEIVEKGLQILLNIDHRGATGADPRAGDRLRDAVADPARVLCREGKGPSASRCRREGDYAIGVMFLPKDREAASEIAVIVEETIAAEGFKLLGWRDVPVDPTKLGDSVRPSEPTTRQVFVGRGPSHTDQERFERPPPTCCASRSRTPSSRARTRASLAITPCRCRRGTIVYKGLLLAGQLGDYFADLRDPKLTTALALVHQRFSTNTFPSWQLAHPYRYVAHNGEINTLRGNVNWMAARQASRLVGPVRRGHREAVADLLRRAIGHRLLRQTRSNSWCRAAIRVTHAMMMLIPEAWAGNPLMDAERKSFYEYHASMMEPWDGPAAVAFTDGRQIGATLDRNGLRPARLLRHRRRARGDGVGGRRAADPRGEDRPEVAPSAG